MGGRWRYVALADYVDTWVDTYHERYVKLREQFGDYEYSAFNFTWNDPLYDANYVPAATPAPASTSAPAATPVPQYQPSYEQSYYEPAYTEEYYDPGYTEQSYDPGYQQSYDPGYQGNDYGYTDPYASQTNPFSGYGGTVSSIPETIWNPPAVDVVPQLPASDVVVDTLVPAYTEGEVLTIP